MIIKNDQQLKLYQQAAKISTQILAALKEAVVEGATPLQVDQLAEELCSQYKVKANFKGQGSRKNPYLYSTCISVNDVVVHGIPDDRPFQAGDIVKLDFGIEYHGLNTDHCFSVGIAPISQQDEALLKASKKAIQKSLKKAIVGNTTGDIGYTIEKTANEAGFEVVKEFVGHGIGHSLHEDPQLPAYGQPGSGEPLQKGMVLCVEAQVVAGSKQIYIENDGWTVKTRDGSKVAMFEYMVVVQKHKPLILTPTLDWGIVTK